MGEANGTGHSAVVWLLVASAVLAAAIGVRAAIVDDNGSGSYDTDEKRLRRLLAAQNQAVDDANTYGSRGQRATYALGLTAISAALLALAGLMGAARSGRIALVTAGAALLFAAVWGGSGFLL